MKRYKAAVVDIGEHEIGSSATHGDRSFVVIDRVPADGEEFAAPLERCKGVLLLAELAAGETMPASWVYVPGQGMADAEWLA